MIFLPSAFQQHVINVDLDISPNLLCEHLVHEPLIHHAHILEAEWHYFIIKEALPSQERSFLLVCFMHSNLVVT